MKKLHYSYLLLALNPFLGLVGNFFSLARKKKPSYLSLVVSIVIIESYFPIMWDARSNFYRIFYFPEEGLNIYTNILNFLSNTIMIPYIVSISIISILILTIHTKLLQKYLLEIQKEKSYSYFILVFILYLFLFKYRSLFDLQKTSLSIALFLLSLNVKSSTLKSITFILACTIHPLMSVFGIIIIIAFIYKKSIFFNIIIFLILSFLGTFGIDYIMNFTVTYLNFSSSIIHYILIGDTKFSSEGIALFVRLLRSISIVVIFVIFTRILMKTKDRNLKFYSQIIIFLSSFSMLVSFNEIALERFYLTLVILVIFTSIRFKVNMKYLLIIVMNMQN